MKSQKINDALWRITAPNGWYADLVRRDDGWHVVLYTATGNQVPCDYGGVQNNRFGAKTEAEEMLEFYS